MALDQIAVQIRGAGSSEEQDTAADKSWPTWAAAPTFAEIMTALGTQHVSVFMLTESSALVTDGGQTFSMCDNGGEINVELVNLWERPVSVPTVINGALSLLTVVAWLLAAMQEQPLDYGLCKPARLAHPEAAAHIHDFEEFRAGVNACLPTR